jgi:glutamine amidotransferase
MAAVRQQGLEMPILEAAQVRQVPILGICLGMQLLASRGCEGGEMPGLGLIEQDVDPFTAEEVAGRKIPHVGIDEVRISESRGLFSGLAETASFYFTHSYRILPRQLDREAGCVYGVEFLAAFQYGNVCGTQFHPEKSQSNGLRLLKSFMEL